MHEKAESSMARRVVRGGAWGRRHGSARASYRDHLGPAARDDLLGLRVVLLPSKEIPMNTECAESSEARRVVRGGAWLDIHDFARASYRYRNHPASRFGNLGLRVVRSSPESLPTEIDFIPIPPGPFVMGAAEDDPLAFHDERPQHTRHLEEYWISKKLITNTQYAAVMESDLQGKPDDPVSGVSWYDAMAFCQALSEQTGLPFGLPTEAQWEKAARGTDGRMYPGGNNYPDDVEKPSPYGMEQCIGVLWQHCLDVYDAEVYRHRLEDMGVKVHG